MFQTPWLPEFLFSLNDYGALKAAYRGKLAVRCLNQTFRE